MSVLYDKSLDQLAEHTWEMSLGFSQWLPDCYWKSNLKYYKMGLLVLILPSIMMKRSWMWISLMANILAFMLICKRCN